VIALVPAKIAIEHSVVPLFVKKEGRKAQLFLGMEEPSDLGVLDDLAFHTGMGIRPVMVGPTEIGEAIDRYYNAKPAPTSTRLPDPMRGADTLSETNLRILREEAPPTLSELLRPGTAVGVVPLANPLLEAVDAAPLVPAPPDPAPSVGPEAPSPKPVPVAAPPSPPAERNAPVAVPDAVPTPAILELRSPVEIQGTPAPIETSAPATLPTAPVAEPMVATIPSAAPLEDLAVEVERAIEETERTRLVAKAIAHLLIEKGILTLDELQARIEKLRPARAGTAE
jgi:hypothetical protein